MVKMFTLGSKVMKLRAHTDKMAKGMVVWDKRGVREKGQTKEQQVNKASRTGSAVVLTEKKYGAGANAAAKNPATGAAVSARKLEEESESFKP